MLTVIVSFRLSILSFSPEKDKACLRQLISFLSKKNRRKVYTSLNRSFVHKQNKDSTGDVTAIYMVIRARRRASRLQCKGVPSFLRYFKTLGNGPAPGNELATSRSAVKRSTV